MRNAGCSYYKTKASQEIKGGDQQIGYAYFAAEKAWLLNPDDTEAFTLRRLLSGLMNDKITHQIGVGVYLESYGRNKMEWPEELRNSEPEIEEIQYSTVPYKQGEEVLNGIMVVSVRLVESSRGAVPYMRQKIRSPTSALARLTSFHVISADLASLFIPNTVTNERI